MTGLADASGVGACGEGAPDWNMRVNSPPEAVGWVIGCAIDGAAGLADGAGVGAGAEAWLDWNMRVNSPAAGVEAPAPGSACKFENDGICIVLVAEKSGDPDWLSGWLVPGVTDGDGAGTDGTAWPA